MLRYDSDVAIVGRVSHDPEDSAAMTMDEAKHPWTRGDLTVRRSVSAAREVEAVAAGGRDEEAGGDLGSRPSIEEG